MLVSIHVGLKRHKNLLLVCLSFSYAGQTFDKCTDRDSVNGRPYCFTTVGKVFLNNMKLPVFFRTTDTGIATSVSTIQPMAAKEYISNHSKHIKN